MHRHQVLLGWYKGVGFVGDLCSYPCPYVLAGVLSPT